jgi:hypothetical protein
MTPHCERTYVDQAKVLEGANPSAEGEDADDGGDGGADSSPILDLAQSFRWNKIEGVSKKVYQADMKGMLRSLCTCKYKD